MGEKSDVSQTTNTKSCCSNHNGRKQYWTRYSEDAMDNAEKKILSCVETPHKRFYVNIGSVAGESDRIWTLALNEHAQKTPLVLLHGMGAGLALWCPNLDALAATRPVYAIDLLGFGRSSRPRFATDALKAEAQWVDSVEEWRRELNLAQFVLLGHSLGGYIATAYAMKYPERVRHLIVADPWGYTVRNEEEINERFRKLSFWQRTLVMSVINFVTNPLFPVRAAGPAGPWLLAKMRSDISKKYIKFLPDAEAVIPEYIYQCNSQPPSGETAFHTLGEFFMYAKHPMAERLQDLHPALPVTDIYGGKSWVPCSSEAIRQNRSNSRVYSKTIKDVGHHIYLDNPEEFNSIVIESCARADEYIPVITDRPVENIDNQSASNMADSNRSVKRNSNVIHARAQKSQSQNDTSKSDLAKSVNIMLTQQENAITVL